MSAIKLTFLGSLFILATGVGLVFVLATYILPDNLPEGQPQTQVDAPAEQVATASVQSANTGWSTQINVSRDGHFYVDAMVSSTPIRFLIDTGASMVALSQEDARRMHLRVDDASYTHSVMTAGGMRRAAKVDLANIRIDDNWFYNVEATIIDGNDDVSILGMSFLRQLENFQFSDRVLTLFW